MNDQNQSWFVVVVVPISCGYPLGPDTCPRLLQLRGVVFVGLLRDCCIMNFMCKVINNYVSVSPQLAKLQ